MTDLLRVARRPHSGCAAVLVLLFLLQVMLPGAVPTAEAATYDLDVLFPNLGFESGLAAWSYTGAGVNANTYLTDAEWTAGTWSNSSPFYSDAQLATLYAGEPWGLTPDIVHIDQTGVSGDPTTTIVAPLGAQFVGSRQDGYEGHYRRAAGEPPQPAGGYYDTNWQLTSDPIAGPFQSGDTFTATVWAVRGRLNGDWATPNANTTGNASTLSVRLVGGTYVAQTMTFTDWAADGQWAMQTFTWQLTSSATSLRIQITGQNKNHDRFVGCDGGVSPTPAKRTTWGQVKASHR